MTLPLREINPMAVFDHADRYPDEALEELCTCYSLEEFRNRIETTMLLALGNPQTAYDCGEARVGVVQYCQSLMKLAEALYTLHFSRQRNMEASFESSYPKKLKKLLKQQRQPRLLSKQEKKHPRQVLQSFTETYQADTMPFGLLDLIDSAMHCPPVEGLKPQEYWIFFYRLLRACTLIARALGPQ